MKRSQLDSFLSHQRAEGVVVSEGAFTLARDKALLKLANFQLPYPGAWAVKVFQAAVAFGASQPLRFSCERKDTTIEFDTPPTFSLPDFEAYFFNPEPHPERAVRHLLSGLWAAGVAQKHSFLLSLPHESYSLIWTGEELERVEGRASEKRSTLIVRNYPETEATPLFGIGPDGSRWNSETLRALTANCYTSPIPLIVDGRRLDGFQFCPTHGWNRLNFPLALQFLEADLPPLPVPPGTLGKLTTEDMRKVKGMGLSDATTALFEFLPHIEETGVAMLLTAHVKAAGVKNFEARPERSLCYWIQDGAVVDSTRLRLVDSRCSVALFLNADELKTDLSSLKLAESEQTKERFTFACRSASAALVSLSLENLEVMVEKARKTSKVVGGLFILAGIGLTFASPYYGISFIGAGAAGLMDGGRARKSWAAEFTDDLKKLTSDWQKAYPPFTRLKT